MLHRGRGRLLWGGGEAERLQWLALKELQWPALKAPLLIIEEGKCRRVMGEMMGIDAAIFFSSGGGVGATVEAARGRPTVAPCAPGGAGGGRRWPVGPCGWAGPAGRPRPSGGGERKSAGKKKKKKDWAESDGEDSFLNKI
jgi:hypothetical protein